MRQSDQNQIFEQIRCKNCSDIEFVGVDLHVRYGFNQIVYEVDKRQIHVHIPLPLGIMICTNLNQHYIFGSDPILCCLFFSFRHI